MFVLSYSFDIRLQYYPFKKNSKISKFQKEKKSNIRKKKLKKMDFLQFKSNFKKKENLQNCKISPNLFSLCDFIRWRVNCLLFLYSFLISVTFSIFLKNFCNNTFEQTGATPRSTNNLERISTRTAYRYNWGCWR